MSEKDKQGLGPSGTCICPKCGFEAPHQVDLPCRETRCAVCGAIMLRKGSQHHQAIVNKRKKEQ